MGILILAVIGAPCLCQENTPQAGALSVDALMKFESMKKERATALAWSLLVPGGAVFYEGGHNEFGTGFALLEVASLGSVIYVGNQVAIGNAQPGDRSMVRVFAGMFLILKAAEVATGFGLVDDFNQRLLRGLCGSGVRQSLNDLPASLTPPRQETLVALQLNF